MMVDNHTEKKMGLHFVRLLIEVEMKAKLLDKVFFKSEKGILVEQKVQFEWKPCLCSYCKMYGHDEEAYWVKKGRKNEETKHPQDQGQKEGAPTVKDDGTGKAQVDNTRSNHKPQQSGWITPTSRNNKPSQQIPTRMEESV